MTGMFRFLPIECQQGTCGHTKPCVRFRSKRCISGECTHAHQNLHCGEAPPAPPVGTDG